MASDSALELCREGFGRIDVGSVLGDSELDEAVRCFDEALSIDPVLAVAWAGKARAFERMRRFGEALACYDRALELGGEDATVWSNKGLLLEGLQRSKQAVECYDRALELDPTNALIWYNKGVSYDGLGREQDAISAYRKSLELDGTDPECWQNLGVDLMQKGDLDGALTCFSKALSIRPGYQTALENRGEAYLRKGDTDGAIADFEAAYPVQSGRPALRGRPDARASGRRPTEGEFALSQRALAAGDFSGLSALLDQCPSLAWEADRDGLRLLDLAAMFGSLALLGLLAKHGADLDVPAPDGRSAFHAAAECAQLAAMIWLRSRGACISRPDGKGRTPLHWAVAEGGHESSAAAVSLLLRWDRGLLEAEAGDDFTPLLEAVRRQNPDMVKLLLAEGADPTRASKREGAIGLTPFIFACLLGNTQVIEPMLSHPEIRPNPPLKEGGTLFGLLASQGKTEVMQYLADRMER